MKTTLYFLLILMLVVPGQIARAEDPNGGVAGTDAPSDGGSVALVVSNNTDADTSELPLAPGTEGEFFGMDFVWIPPGTFTMGSPRGEKDKKDDEKQHQVTLTQGFWMGKYEVTQTQWRSVMESNPSHFRGSNFPVDNVSWEDCQKFIEKLNERHNQCFRLPTEAEWEYACRAGTTTPFSFGETISTDQVNFDGATTYGSEKKGGINRKQTMPVSRFPPNPWGLHDMHGNVCEWCQDWYYSLYPSDAQTDPQGPETGRNRVLRGGWWNSYWGLCRSACRGGAAPSAASCNIGFRLVLPAVQ